MSQNTAPASANIDTGHQPNADPQNVLINEASRSFMRQNAVMVIGVGAVGSALADTLYRMGDWLELILVDHDRVEPRNYITQGYRHSDNDMPKVTALERYLAGIFPPSGVGARTTRIRPINTRWDADNVGYAPVVFMCVDNIDVRRQIAERLPISAPYCHDIRIGGLTGDSLAITPNNNGREYYPTTLFPPNEAASGECAGSSFNGTAKLLVGVALTNQFLQFLRQVPVTRHLKLNDGYVTEPKESLDFSRQHGNARRETRSTLGANV